MIIRIHLINTPKKSKKVIRLLVFCDQVKLITTF